MPGADPIGGSGDRDGALRLRDELVCGRWTVLDRFECVGRRYVVARRKDPTGASPELTVRERECASMAATGCGNVEIAQRLGLAASTVSVHVRSAMRKLGLTRRTDLVDVFEVPGEGARVVDVRSAGRAVRVMSFPCASSAPMDTELTPSERAVTRALMQGASNREIARARGTSDRTVANQIQSIYRKLGVCSRMELATVLRRRREAEPDPASSTDGCGGGDGRARPSRRVP